MRTSPSPPLLSLRDTVADAVLRPERDDASVGLELEAFPMAADGRRVPLDVTASRLSGYPVLPGPDPSFRLPGAKLTFEPGGQVEVSADPQPTISGAVHHMRETWIDLAARLEGRPVFAGLDLWNEVAAVPLQLSAPRYSAMDEYFARRWSVGALMMRHTGSLQINLDGGGRQLDQRLRVAQAMAPAIIASFSTSPTPRHHSGRAVVWDRLDDSRTGLLSDTDAVTAVHDKAMRAGVLVVRRGERWEAAPDDLTFCRWVEGGHPRWGAPTPDDLIYHLSTIFTEVRPRVGTLEIRTPDAVPLRYLAPVVVLITSLVYSPEFGEAATQGTSWNDLRALGVQAAENGVEDPEVAAYARRTWRLALDAATRSDGIDPEHLASAADTVERLTDRNRSLSHDLADAMAVSPEAGIEWATQT